MKKTLLASLALTLCCAVANAQSPQQGRRPGQGVQQQRGGGGAGGGRGSRPGTQGSSTLERAGLKLGQKLPDLTIFDEAGDKFRVADVKGKHTVIVFGCLT